MTHERLPPLSPELTALLASTDEAALAPPPAGAKTRVLERVESTLGLAFPGAGGDGEGGGGPAPGGGAVAPARLASPILPTAIATFVLGGLVGAVLHARLASPPAPREVPVATAATSAATAALTARAAPIDTPSDAAVPVEALPV